MSIHMLHAKGQGLSWPNRGLVVGLTRHGIILLTQYVLEAIATHNGNNMELVHAWRVYRHAKGLKRQLAKLLWPRRQCKRGLGCHRRSGGGFL